MNHLPPNPSPPRRRRRRAFRGDGDKFVFGGAALISAFFGSLVDPGQPSDRWTHCANQPRGCDDAQFLGTEAAEDGALRARVDATVLTDAAPPMRKDGKSFPAVPEVLLAGDPMGGGTGRWEPHIVSDAQRRRLVAHEFSENYSAPDLAELGVDFAKEIIADVAANGTASQELVARVLDDPRFDAIREEVEPRLERPLRPFQLAIEVARAFDPDAVAELEAEFAAHPEEARFVPSFEEMGPHALNLLISHRLAYLGLTNKFERVDGSDMSQVQFIDHDFSHGDESLRLHQAFHQFAAEYERIFDGLSEGHQQLFSMGYFGLYHKNVEDLKEIIGELRDADVRTREQLAKVLYFNDEGYRRSEYTAWNYASLFFGPDSLERFLPFEVQARLTGEEDHDSRVVELYTAEAYEFFLAQLLDHLTEKINLPAAGETSEPSFSGENYVRWVIDRVQADGRIPDDVLRETLMHRELQRRYVQVIDRVTEFEPMEPASLLREIVRATDPEMEPALQAALSKLGTARRRIVPTFHDLLPHEINLLMSNSLIPARLSLDEEHGVSPGERMLRDLMARGLHAQRQFGSVFSFNEQYEETLAALPEEDREAFQLAYHLLYSNTPGALVPVSQSLARREVERRLNSWEDVVSVVEDEQRGEIKRQVQQVIRGFNNLALDFPPGLAARLTGNGVEDQELLERFLRRGVNVFYEQLAAHAARNYGITPPDFPKAQKRAGGGDEHVVGAAPSADEAECFAAGTQVHTPTGPIDIKDIRVGDWVFARGPPTAAVEPRRVLRTFVTPRQPVLRLTLVHPERGDEDIRVTYTHPFFVENKGWTAAQHIALGDQIVGAEGASTAQALVAEAELVTVHNFEVEGLHSYFVGQSQAWVHNRCRYKPAVGQGLIELEEANLIADVLPMIKPIGKRYEGPGSVALHTIGRDRWASITLPGRDYQSTMQVTIQGAPAGGGGRGFETKTVSLSLDWNETPRTRELLQLAVGGGRHSHGRVGPL